MWRWGVHTVIISGKRRIAAMLWRVMRCSADGLGAGGMGEGYRAQDPRLNRDVAITILPERPANNPQALTRFETGDQ
jgi:hypothetical protein